MSKRAILQSAGYLLYLFLLLEITCRIYLRVGYGVSLLRPYELPFKIYPALETVYRTPITRSDKFFDVLLLGASVFVPEWGSVEKELKQQIPRENVRIHNPSTRAHTSLDSLYKYRYLAGKEFDLVILYHGINEVRMNNVSREAFKEDYSHYHWYGVINSFERYRRFPYLAFPYAVECILAALGQELGLLKYEPVHIDDIPLEVRKRYGAEIKTREPFRRNMSRIIETAQLRGDPLLLMTFAFHYPEDYNLQSFTEKTLDYAEHKSPVEIWGYSDHVVKGLDRHNEVIRSLSRKYESVSFVDLDREIPKNREYFDDVCHFTPEGSSFFARVIVESLSR